MPTYDYKCTQCGYVTELLHGMEDTPVAICEACGGDMTKQIGTGGYIAFKGTGFHCNDYEKCNAKRKDTNVPNTSD